MQDRADYNDRILVIDDDPDIRKVFTSVLARRPEKNKSAISALEDLLDEDDPRIKSGPANSFSVDTAEQGEDGFEMIRKADEAGRPYAAVFIDIRMPPGWDGIKTAREIRRVCPLIAIIIVTAYSDATVKEIVEKVGFTDRLLYLKKPFEREEISQLADSLVMRWNLEHRLRDFRYILEDILEQLVDAAFSDQLGDIPHFLNRVLNRFGALIGTLDIFLAETDGKKVVNSTGLGRFDNSLDRQEIIVPLVEQALAQEKFNTSFSINGYQVMAVASRTNPSLVIGLKPGRQVEGMEEVLDILARNISRVYDVAAEIVRLRQGK